jgi:hypothetical protein
MINQSTHLQEIKKIFKGMICVFYTNQVTTESIVRLHKIVEDVTCFRTEEKSTLSGVSYAPTNTINEYMSKVCNLNNKPFLKLAILNWLSPFDRGNRKITNLIFLKETGFNFDITNQVLIDDMDYILENFYSNNDERSIREILR